MIASQGVSDAAVGRFYVVRFDNGAIECTWLGPIGPRIDRFHAGKYGGGWVRGNDQLVKAKRPGPWYRDHAGTRFKVTRKKLIISTFDGKYSAQRVTRRGWDGLGCPRV